jgi:hypothetical protein
MERSCEASEAQSEIQKEHVAYLKEKDKKKKDKAEKWHGLSRRLVLNAASTNGHVPATEIPESYQLVINSETAAMADKELHSQMVALGHREIGFAHGTAASLYNGSIIWNARDKPSNLSFFTLYENNPLNDEQKSRYLHLNILNSNTDNKNLDEIKASQKQIVSVPKDYAELLNVIKMYRGMVTIVLFGPESALTVEMGRALALIEQEFSTIKVRIAGDFRYPAKILYAFEIRIQRWLNLCEQQEDRSTINDIASSIWTKSWSKSCTAASRSTSPSFSPPANRRKKREKSPPPHQQQEEQDSRGERRREGNERGEATTTAQTEGSSTRAWSKNSR